MKFFQDLIRILQELNDRNSHEILQELDDHRILMKFSRAFDQNSYVRFQGLIRIPMANLSNQLDMN